MMYLGHSLLVAPWVSMTNRYDIAIDTAVGSVHEVMHAVAGL